MLLPLVSPFIDLMFLFGTLNYLVDRHFHPDTASSASFQKLVLFFALFLIIDFVASTVAFALERAQGRSSRDKWLLSQVWLQRFAIAAIFSGALQDAKARLRRPLLRLGQTGANRFAHPRRRKI